MERSFSAGSQEKHVSTFPSPPPPVRMRKLLGWGVLGQITYVLCQFITLLALTRFATIEEVGVYGLATALVIPVFFFFDLDMRINVASSKTASYAFQDFRTLLSISVLAGICVVLVIGLVGMSGSALTILLILGATKAAETFSNFSYGVFQRFDRMHIVAKSLMLRSIAGTAFFVLLLVWGAAVEFAFLAQFAVWSAVAFGVDHPRALRLWRTQGGREGQSWGRILTMARESLPLALNGLLSALQGNAPRYVIGWLLGVAALGQFTVVGYAMQAISTVAMAGTQSLVARVRGFIEAGHQNALRRTLAKLLGGLLVFSAVGVILSAVFGDWIVERLFGAEYSELGSLLALCVLAAGLRSVVLVLQMCLLAARRFGQNLLIRTISTVLMLTACGLGGVQDGLTGVAWGMCAAFVLHIAALTLAVRPLGAPPTREQ